MAVQELQLGDSDMVISGGVDTMNNIFMFMCFSKTPALSPTGDCRPFSDKADGTMLGEGLGMVALKRLEDAERDGDPIYAVINGIGSSSDGRSKSVYAPRSEGQAAALRRAYAKAGYGPDTVELVEAHGTGTIAGDAAEFRGLTAAFDESGRTDRQWCTLGSVKSQIGHTKAAAGAAGLFKTVMALHHKVLPPTIKVEQPNPSLQMDESPFHLCTQARPWVRASNHPRRASVSSFGFGGSNFHVALSEYEPRNAPGRRAPRLPTMNRHLVLLGGGEASEIVRDARDLGTRADTVPEGFAAWCARDTQTRFQALVASGDARSRLAVLASDEADLAAKLRKAADTIEANPNQDFALPTGLYYGTGEPAGTDQTAFVFPGQGSQYLHMGGDVAMHFSEASAVWDLTADAGWSSETKTSDVVFPPTAFDQRSADLQTSRLAATEWAQPAIGSVSLALLALLDRLGLKPAHTGGHSYGEITSLHAAGVLNRKEFLEVSRRRGELMARAATSPGAMVAVAQSIETVRERLSAWSADLVIANHNGPTQVVLSGAVSKIEKAEAAMVSEGIAHRRLPVATAFHSSIVAGAAQSFGEFLESVEFATPECKVYSNVSATEHASDPASIRRALAEQLRNPVRFVEMIEAMYENGARTFVEVGPGAVTSGLVASILGERPHTAISLDRKGKNGVESLLLGLAQLSAAGLPLDFDALWAEYATPANPEDTAKPKVALTINGANYGKPYPPAGGTVSLPPPNPPRPEAVPHAGAAVSVHTNPLSEIDTMKKLEPPAPPVASPRVSQQEIAPTTVLAAPLNPRWAASYQEVQRQTAEAHAVYLKSMADTHTLFLQTTERGFSALGAPAQPIAASTIPFEPASMPAAPSSMAVSTPTPPLDHLQTQQTPDPIPSPLVARTAITSEGTTAVNIDLHALMLEIVSDKTGYPTEMLTRDMALEGDLGIDSIKRVEILSSMTDRVPELPEPTPPCWPNL